MTSTSQQYILSLLWQVCTIFCRCFFGPGCLLSRIRYVCPVFCNYFDGSALSCVIIRVVSTVPILTWKGLVLSPILEGESTVFSCKSCFLSIVIGLVLYHSFDGLILSPILTLNGLACLLWQVLSPTLSANFLFRTREAGFLKSS